MSMVTIARGKVNMGLWVDYLHSENLFDYKPGLPSQNLLTKVLLDVCAHLISCFSD